MTIAEDAVVLDAYSEAVSSVARRVTPSIVSVRIDRTRGGGSGVVITPDGFVLTSAHVAGRGRSGRATFSDGAELPFRVVGADPLSDLAVLHVDTRSAEPARLGDADALVVGQLVVAIGNPLGFVGSVSAGVVSGLGRSMPTHAGSVQRIIEDVIQTDASLHPGNSGGALAISNGDVVGINTAVVGPGIGQGLGLAVPINTATRAIIGTLIQDGRVRRAYIGLAGGARPLPPSVARHTAQSRGVEITSVVATSPADDAGFRPGDVLLSLDDVAIESVTTLQRLMTAERIDRPIAATVWRDGRVIAATLCPTELPN